jgi:hypothetical protein
MHEAIQLDLITAEIVSYLGPESACESACVCDCWKNPSVKVVDAAFETKFAAAIPSVAARQQLVRLLGAPLKPARAALAWRRRAAKRAQKLEMLQSFMDKSIGAAQLEGADIFAACKRAMLFSEDPAVSDMPEVERWMAYIVEAVDSGCFEDSVWAWRWFAEQGLLEDGGARWLLQLAHSLGNIRAAAPLITEYPALRQHLEAYAVSLAARPHLGQYTLHHRRVTNADIRRLLDSIA